MASAEHESGRGPDPQESGRGPGPQESSGGPDPRPGAMEDAISRLEERLDRASEAAERLLADAAQRVSSRPPPAGWQQPPPEDGAGRSDAFSLLGGDADLLLGIVSSLRDRIPPDLQQRLAEAVREVLLALRALIDWYLERSQQRRAQPSEVQDIPIL
jgi:hypothetical protein